MKKQTKWGILFTGFLVVLIALSIFAWKYDPDKKAEKKEATEETGKKEKDNETAGAEAGEGEPEEKPEENPEESPVSEAEQNARTILAGMSTEEKAAQLFFVQPEAITGVETAVRAGDTTKAALEKYPVGGIVYFAQNIRDPEQLKEMIANTKSYSRITPFIGVDEEGGSLVARIAKNEAFQVTKFPDMIEIGASGDPNRAFEVGDTIGAYLKELGFNMDFAPDADVLTNPQNPVIGRRSFGEDAQMDARMVEAAVKGFLGRQISPVVKHFPGHGDTTGDSHEGQVVSNRTLAQMRETEFLPFKAGIDAGVPFVMVGHISVPDITGDMTPATLSSKVITDILRGELGFDRIVITDSMKMEAITKYYGSGEAAVRAVQAGVDMLLMPDSFEEAYQGILNAVADGTIPMERLDASVLRILTAKQGI